MSAISKIALGILLAVLVAATPLACGGGDQGPSQDKPHKDVNVGGEYGVDVKRSDSGTKVKVGGDRGVVVDHPHDQQEDK